MDDRSPTTVDDSSPSALLDVSAALGLTPAAEPHRYDLVLDRRLGVGDRAHGGFLLAAMSRAAAQEIHAEAGHWHPVAAVAQYHAAAELGPVSIQATVRRSGRSVSQVVTTLRQGGVPVADGLVTLGTLSDAGTDPVWSEKVPPEMPPIAECFALPVPQSRSRMQIWEHVRVHLDPATAGWVRRQPSRVPETRAWVQFGGDAAPDPFTLLVALDIMPSVSLEFRSRGWVPTLQLSAYLRAQPVPGPLRIRQYTTRVDRNMMDQTCEVWDPDGRLVAHSIQLTGVSLGAEEQ